MYIPFTAESIIAGANKIASTTKSEKPWWFFGSTEAYIRKTKAEKYMLADWNSELDKILPSNTNEELDIMQWINENKKLAFVGLVALFVLLKH